MNQRQLFEAARKRADDMIQTAGWLCGLHGFNPNPLSDQEIQSIAESDKPYAWAFRQIAEVRSAQPA